MITLRRSVRAMVLALVAVSLAAAVGRSEAPAAGINADLKDALEQANKADRILLVDFYGGWCPWCVKMDETLANPEVKAILEKQFFYYKLDVGRFDQHPECLKQYEVKGIPFIAVFNADGSIRATHGGYMTVDAFKEFLSKAAAGPVAAEATAQACPEADRLAVVQDESSMERLIETYLTKVHNLVIKEKTQNKDDLYLELPFNADKTPAFRITIDTQSTNREDGGKVLERGVLVNLLTGVKVAQEHRDAVLATLNDFNRRKIFSSAYIDTDGEIVCCWTVNVMAEGLPTEYVYDAVARVQKNWVELYPLAAKDL